MTDRTTYTIVVPVYNGGSSLKELCDRVVNTLQQYSFDLIFVDDESSDNSWSVICQLKEQYPELVKGLRLKKNSGQHAALLCAFAFCKAQYVVTIDDDLQYGAEDILTLINTQRETGADVVYGLLANKHESALRNAVTYYVNKTSKIDGKYEKGSSFRLISRDITDTIVANHKSNFIFIDEVLQWYATSIVSVAVSHRTIAIGKSRYSYRKLLEFYVNIVTNYSALPLKIMVFLGGFFSTLFFLAGVVFILKKILYDVPMGFTALIVAILFSSSIIMFCLGIIGLYLFKIYSSQQNKPLYTIDKVI